MVCGAGVVMVWCERWCGENAGVTRDHHPNGRKS